MTDDSSNLVDMDNLDTFSSTFFNPNAEPPKQEVEQPEAETEDDALATEHDDPEAQEEPEEKPEGDDKPKGKKSAQERINEVVAKQREAERERDALRQKLADLEAAATKKPEVEQKSEPSPLREQLSPDAPDPDAKLEDGSPKYKLGEFDPQYIRDLTKFTIAEERARLDAEAAKVAEQRQVEAAQQELQSSWEQKLVAIEEELPDVREKLGSVEAAFQGIDAGYGEFLAATIMSCDHGPEIMYYFSQNIDEAKKIVASGPAAATLALGRLDAKFTKAASSEEPRNKKTSAAPEPAPTHTRGSGGKFATRGDTNDLAAFEREFYPQKK